MRKVAVGITTLSSTIAFLIVIAGCDRPRGKEQVDPIVELKNHLRTLEERLAADEAKLAVSVATNARMSESIESLRNQIKQMSAERILPKDLLPILERLATLEKAAATQIQVQADPPKPNGHVARTKASMLEALQRDHRKALLTGISEEMQLRELATYQYFKEKIESGVDPRLSSKDLENMDASGIYILRYYSDFLPEEN